MVTSDAPSFMPHGHCFYWQKDILYLHVGSDLVIALAYFSIPFALLYLAKKRPDLSFNRFFMLFAVFILACGITHVLNVWNFWYADYWISGYAKAITAVASLLTAFLLWKVMPVALSWPSPALMEKANAELHNEISLRLEKEVLLQEAFDNAPIGKALVGLDGRWIRVNNALCSILGYTKEEMMNTDFQSITFEEDLDEDLRHVKDLIKGRGDAYQMEKRYKHKSGHLVWALLSVTIVRDEQRSPRYFIAQILDITYRKLSESELRRNQAELEARVKERTRELEVVNNELSLKNAQLETLSTTDQLTQLYNRRYFLSRLSEHIEEAIRYKTEFSIMLIDIDKFKAINDNHGHNMGDSVIACIGSTLKSSLRHTDVAARIGGDEFCVLLPHTSLRRAPAIANNIRKSIKERCFSIESGDEFSISCSIGIAEFDDSITECRGILEKADKALYSAKDNGRDCVQINAG